MIEIKHLLMNSFSALNNPQRIHMPASLMLLKDIPDMYSKSIEIKDVFTKGNEMLIFFKIVLLEFNTFILAYFSLVEEPLKLFWYGQKLRHCIIF